MVGLNEKAPFRGLWYRLGMRWLYRQRGWFWTGFALAAAQMVQTAWGKGSGYWFTLDFLIAGTILTVGGGLFAAALGSFAEWRRAAASRRNQQLAQSQTAQSPQRSE